MYDRKMLLQYLDAVLKLEISQHKTSSAIAQINNQKQPISQQKPVSTRNYPEDFALFGFFIGAIVAIIMQIIDSINFFLFIVALFGFGGIGWLALYIIGGIVGLFLRPLDKSKHAKVLKEESQMTARKNQILSDSTTRLSQLRQNTNNTLQNVYARNIIHPKYRNLVAISSIYEYLDTGRCSALEGSDGAYNLFENERRLDRIIDKLDIIISNLEQIRANQYCLYKAMEGIQREVGNLSKAVSAASAKLDAIHANLQVMSYVTREMESNQYYQKTFANTLRF